jgi:hypothetical protein
LGESDNLKLFPKRYNEKTGLAESKLLISKPYSKPDSIVYLDRLQTKYNSKRGYIYFFKYKEKKDDPTWKLATVGLLSLDPKEFEVKFTSPFHEYPETDEDWDLYNFTSFTESKFSDTESVPVQLNKELKKILYSRRNSAKEFYDLTRANEEVYALKNRN